MSVLVYKLFNLDLFVSNQNNTTVLREVESRFLSKSSLQSQGGPWKVKHTYLLETNNALELYVFRLLYLNRGSSKPPFFHWKIMQFCINFLANMSKQEPGPPPFYNFLDQAFLLNKLLDQATDDIQVVSIW